MGKHYNPLEKEFLIHQYQGNMNIKMLPMSLYETNESNGSIRSSAKKMFIDPSIMTASLGLSPEILLQDFHTFGFIFENLS
jgi:hypothetical protein